MTIAAAPPVPRAAGPTAAISRRSYFALLAVTAVLLVMPFFLVRFPPLVDYPNHLARTFVLFHIDDDAWYRQFYDVSLAPIPNVAMDVLVYGLQFLFAPEIAGKVFLALTALLFLAGVHRLGVALTGEPQPHASVAGYFFFSSMLLYGFVNYTLGLGLFAFGLAEWLDWRCRPTFARSVGVFVLVALAYLAHLTSYAFLGMAAGYFALLDLCRNRRPLRAGLTLTPFVPPVFLFFGFMRGGGQMGSIVANTMRGKVIGLLSVFRSYATGFDLVVAALFCVLFLLAVLARPRCDRDTLALSGLFFIAYLLCPKVLFTSWAADVRAIVPAYVLLVLAFIPQLGTLRGRLLFGALVICMVVRLGAITVAWRELDRKIGTVVAVLETLPEHSRVFASFGLDEANDDAAKRTVVLQHAVQYAVLRRRAYVNTLFAFRSQQPLVTKDVSPVPEEFDAATLLRRGFTHAWIHAKPGAHLSDGGKLLSNAGGVELWNLTAP